MSFVMTKQNARAAEHGLGVEDAPDAHFVPVPANRPVVRQVDYSAEARARRMPQPGQTQLGHGASFGFEEPVEEPVPLSAVIDASANAAGPANVDEVD